MIRRARLVATCCIVAAQACAAAMAQSQTAALPADVDPRLRQVLLAAVAEARSFDDRFTAEVWLADMSGRLARKVPDVDERLKILRTVHQQASHAALPPELVLAVIDVESDFDRFAISSASALGLMQVMPFWVKELGHSDKNLLFDIEFNLLLGCRILKYYIDMERGDLIQGLARYNGSRGRRGYSDRVIERLRTRWYRI